jgi:hypothetical protein
MCAYFGFCCHKITNVAASLGFTRYCSNSTVLGSARPSSVFSTTKYEYSSTYACKLQHTEVSNTATERRHDARRFAHFITVSNSICCIIIVIITFPFLKKRNSHSLIHKIRSIIRDQKTQKNKVINRERTSIGATSASYLKRIVFQHSSLYI